MNAALKQLAEAAFRHPFCAIEVARIDLEGAVGIYGCVQAEEHFYDLAPVRAGGICVKQADV